MGKKVEKKQTLRQKLRRDAEAKLLGLMEQTRDSVSEIANGAGLSGPDLIRVCATGYNKTLRDQLVSLLANQAEAELMRIYNNQQGLPLGDDNAKD
jgi:hypothetical protein